MIRASGLATPQAEAKVSHRSGNNFFFFVQRVDGQELAHSSASCCRRRIITDVGLGRGPCQCRVKTSSPIRRRQTAQGCGPYDAGGGKRAPMALSEGGCVERGNPACAGCRRRRHGQASRRPLRDGSTRRPKRHESAAIECVQRALRRSYLSASSWLVARLLRTIEKLDFSSHSASTRVEQRLRLSSPSWC